MLKKKEPKNYNFMANRLINTNTPKHAQSVLSLICYFFSLFSFRMNFVFDGVYDRASAFVNDRTDALPQQKTSRDACKRERNNEELFGCGCVLHI